MLELPVTTVQDYTLFHVLNEYSINLWKTQIELIQQKNGLISFIVHPDYVIEAKSRSTYENLLKHIQISSQENNIWCARPTEINNWWRARSRMTLAQEGNAWRIKGKGAERAVLAYAVNADGRITYEFDESARFMAWASATR
jgi:hypothetical protein